MSTNLIYGINKSETAYAISVKKKFVFFIHSLNTKTSPKIYYNGSVQANYMDPIARKMKEMNQSHIFNN